jgi:hypothetical protein
VVAAGDFNNSVTFDKPRDPLKFSAFLANFEALGLRSLYHLDRGCAHGSEPDDTFFLHHDRRKGYHIDFVFATPALHAAGFTFEIGKHATWKKSSDHMPLICSFGTVAD